MRPIFPKPTTSVLLVIDMQEYFREVAEPILRPLTELLQRVREASIPIIYTQHGHRDPASDGGMLFEWWDTFDAGLGQICRHG